MCCTREKEEERKWDGVDSMEMEEESGRSDGVRPECEFCSWKRVTIRERSVG